MSKKTAQFVIVGIFAARIALEVFQVIPDSVEIHFDALLVLVQGWMVNDAYSRNESGEKVG